MGHVFQPKESPVTVTAASEAFKHEFHNDKRNRRQLRIDTVLTSEQAARMLREQETPSATDEFPTLKGPWAAMDFRNTASKGATDQPPPATHTVDLDDYFANRD